MFTFFCKMLTKKEKLAHGNNCTLQRLSIESKIKIQIHHVQEVCSVMTKNEYSLANVTLESFENWTLCLTRSRFHHSLVGL